MFRYFVYLCLLALAAAQGVGYNYASESIPVPSAYFQPPDTAPATPPIAPDSQYAAAVPVATASQQHIQHIAPGPRETEYHKEFYYFYAPVESVSHPEVVQAAQPVAAVKKHLNVIFITAPESGKAHYQQPLRNAVSSHAVEETKTHIYVLSKEPSRSAPSPAASQQHITTTHQSHQPEVHYVNYNSPVEANQLQQQIVQQYGGGNVVDLGGQLTASNVNRQYLAPSASNVNNQYLPPAPVPSNAYIPPRFFFKQ